MNNITYIAALSIARDFAGIRTGDIVKTGILLRGAYYEIVIRESFMKYEFYVDAETGEVCGLNYEPVMPAATVEYSCCAA